MHLPKPFYRLPLMLDVERLRAEVSTLPDDAWVAHPNAFDGNSAVRLISADGGANDAVFGSMLPTEHLQQCPYMRQVLASFAVVWSRSRLMRLAPGAVVPQHADINYHWFRRVRLHMPIFTQPSVRFHCDGETVHMAAGEVWLFDNWRLHSVENASAAERIHLVADTAGSSTFWRFVRHSEADPLRIYDLRYDPAHDAKLLTERNSPHVIMTPSDVELLLHDVSGELRAETENSETLARLQHARAILEAFSQDWRQLYLLHGEAQDGWPEFEKLRDGLMAEMRRAGEGLVMRSNGVALQALLLGRVSQHLLLLPEKQTVAASPPRRDARRQFSRPIFVVAAPRSGSTLLYETLAVNRSLGNLGGEAHWLVEGIDGLQPGAPGVDSNRLTAEHCTPEFARRIADSALRRMQLNDEPVDLDGIGLRLLEKTPKNALRIPFFKRIFPDAKFVFLWRDPRENISSIMEAWRSGNWVTYRRLPDWDGAWSLLLPPGWRALRGMSLEAIAAYQWESTNRIVLDDLAELPRDRWIAVSYAALLQQPENTLRRLCDFAEVPFDAAVQERVRGPLPLSRYTQTPPASDKWRRNQAEIERVLPGIERTWSRLQAL